MRLYPADVFHDDDDTPVENADYFKEAFTG